MIHKRNFYRDNFGMAFCSRWVFHDLNASCIFYIAKKGHPNVQTYLATISKPSVYDLEQNGFVFIKLFLHFLSMLLVFSQK